MGKKKVTAAQVETTGEATATVIEAPAKAPKKAAKKEVPAFSDDLAAAQAAAPKKVGLKKVADQSTAETSGSSKSVAKYDLAISGKPVLSAGSKIQLAVALVKHALANGMTVTELNTAKFVNTFALLREYPLGTSREHIASDLGKNAVRYALKEDKMISHEKSVFVMCNQWYPANTDKMITALSDRFSELSVICN